jgi:hypothetical protein
MVVEQVGHNLQALAKLAASLPTYAGPLPSALLAPGSQPLRRTPRRMSVVTRDAGT